MKQYAVVFIFTVLIGVSSAEEPESLKYKMPSWLKNRIEVMQPSWVGRYVYNKQTAYLIAYPCCEDGSPVYDASGQLVCRLGTWDWNAAKGCPKFEKEAQDEQIVWGEKY